MTGVDGAPSLEEIPRDECLRLVAQFDVGRLAVAGPDQGPLVVPVNYVLDGESIVFRSDPGTKIAGLEGQPASFQVDQIDPFHRTGWSVLLRGIAREAVEADVEHLGLTPWVGERRHWFRLVPTAVTGRRIVLSSAATDQRGYL